MVRPMGETEWLAERFEQHRPRLRAVAYRMLGSLAEADDAVQDAWLRLSQSRAGQIDNLGGWLTTVVARECLHVLRARRHRREDSFGAHLPDPVITPDGDLDPDLTRQRQVVDAFFAAARAGDFDALVQVLDPDVVARADLGAGRPPAVIRGVQAVAKLARAPRGAQLHPALVNGTVGVVITRNGRPFSVLAFTVVNGKIVQIDGIRDPDRVRRVAAAVLTEAADT
jgi:RNA polymerase sigma factor (sigma-70 family)